MATILDQERALPARPGDDNIVQWHVFRHKDQAGEQMAAVHLSPGQHLVGGYSRDSVGPLWWVGVRVDDLEHWGNRQAMNKKATA